MQRDDLVYVGHMLDLVQKVIEKVCWKSRADYDADENLRLALTHLVQTIGEAARRVSPECQAGHPEIPWRPIIGMRHKVVHDYMEVDYDLVWDVATVNIPTLLEALRRLVLSAKVRPEEQAGN